MVSSPVSQQSIVWLASYPRSGNTFVRLLLANYLLARFEPVSIHILKDFNFGEHIQWLWEKVTGAPATGRSEKTEWQARAAYFKLLRATTPPVAYRFLKTHTLNCTRWGVPAFNFRADDRIIYVARDPRDVAVSLAGFHGWNSDQAVSHLLEPYASLSGYPNVGHEVTGTWNLHVHSWLGAKNRPLLMLSYSDLVDQPAACLTRVLAFLGVVPNPVHVNNAVNWANFDGVKEQEVQSGFPEAPKGPGKQPFFRAGKVGQWRTALTPNQADRIVNACSAGMELIGVPPDETLKVRCG